MATAISLLCSAAIACTVPAILPASTAPSYSTPPIATEAPAVSEDFTVLEQEMLDLINDARETAGLPPACSSRDRGTTKTRSCAPLRSGTHSAGKAAKSAA